MVAYDRWITTSQQIGALFGAIAGFFYGAYVMATSVPLGWTDVSDTLGSVFVVLLFAGLIGSLCLAIGWLAGWVLGVLASPLGSFVAKRRELDAREPKVEQKKAA